MGKANLPCLGSAGPEPEWARQICFISAGPWARQIWAGTLVGKANLPYFGWVGTLVGKANAPSFGLLEGSREGRGYGLK